MTVATDERTARRARARAQAASILDTPAVPRNFVVTDRHALVGTERRRRHARAAAATPAAAGAHPRRRRRIAALILVAQVGVLVALLLHPAFKVRTVEVQGTRLLSAATVQRISGVGTGQSIFTVNADSLRRRLLADPWVASATVETALPGTVRITVTERVPVLRVRRSDADFLVAAGGATLAVGDAGAGAGAVPALPVLVDQRPALNGTPAAVDPALLGVLADTAATFPHTFGVAVSSFRWQADGVLTIVTAPGWTAVLGHVDDPDRVAAIPAQLAALLALKGRLDFAKPAFGYVDLEDPAAPAVGGTPGPPQPVPSASAPPPAATKPVTAAPAGPTPISVGPSAGAAATPAPNTQPTPVVVPSH